MKLYKSLEEVPCKFYYAVLDPHSIWNFLDIPDDLKSHRQEFYDTLEASVLKEGFRNPIYVMAVKSYPTRKLKRKLDKNSSWRSYHERHDFFWTNDEDNPIWLPRRKIPRDKMSDGVLLLCRMLGGSRLWVAQKHNIKIPCIISDFTDILGNLKELKSEEEILATFTDSAKVGFNSYGAYSLKMSDAYLNGS